MSAGVSAYKAAKKCWVLPSGFDLPIMTRANLVGVQQQAEER